MSTAKKNVAKKAVAKKVAVKKAVAKKVTVLQKPDEAEAAVVVADTQPEPSKDFGAGREVIYPAFSVKQFVGANALTAEQARKLLGWEEQPDGVEWDEYLCRDIYGHKIKAHNNVKNRPLRSGNVDACMQDILRKQWELNGQTIVIGETGLIINGQHRLIGLVLADMIFNKRPEDCPRLDAAPTLETIVVFGVKETERVFNTIDTGVSRSLADILYHSEYLLGMSQSAKKNMAKTISHSVRMLWNRTGKGLDAFAPSRTHSEMLEFIELHPHIIKACKFIVDEDSGEQIRQYLTPGYMSAIMYIMAASATEPDAYHHASERTEENIDFANWEKAEEFFTSMSTAPNKFADVREAIANCQQQDEEDPDAGGLGGTVAERVAIIIKAWNLWIANKPMLKKSLSLDYQITDAGNKVLAEDPQVGGIDLGSAKKVAPKDEEEAAPSFVGAGTIKGRKVAKAVGKWKAGELYLDRLYWHKDSDGKGQHRQAYLKEISGTQAKLFHSGENWECHVDELYVAKPE